VNTPLPPAGGLPATDNDTMNKETTTATSPTVRLENTPALATPLETIPAASSGTSSAATAAESR
jgi:hypothetical protein